MRSGSNSPKQDEFSNHNQFQATPRWVGSLRQQASCARRYPGGRLGLIGRMEIMSEYWKKLKDPRWQKKRLEVMERDEFTCRTCGSKAETLTVHHINYRKGVEPWGYDAGELVCLCEDCHSKVEKDLIPRLRRLAVRSHAYSISEMIAVLECAMDECERRGDPITAVNIFWLGGRSIQSNRIAAHLGSLIDRGHKFKDDEDIARQVEVML